MSSRTQISNAPSSATALLAIAALFGGEKVLRRKLSGVMDAHQLLLDGLPARALVHLIDSLLVLDKDTSLEKAVGMSVRTVQRRKEAHAKPLSAEQSGRVWSFASALAQATTVFGSQRAAEEWLQRPALALDGKRPLDLLATPAGAALVETHLRRLEYGVYT
ncbi:MAG: antitoxin Xre/MbcA/ParS toxin-binding domain-containing protein [Hyphomicrobium sp.]|nr:antitoxin Xre/MbcA/ParS toxin-binding domain-containing protein [Hyphomicrobium sp.]